VQRVTFLENGAFRAQEFQIPDGNARLEDIDGQEALVATSDAGMTEVRIEHGAIASPELRAHEMHNFFSNGDVLLYSGYYDVYLIQFADGREEGADKIDYVFSTDADEKVVLKSQTYDHQADWRAETDSGRRAYVYFGQLPMVHHAEAGYFTIVDPAVPAWVKAKFDASTETLFREYQQRLFQLPFEPTIFFSAMQPNTEDESDYSGQVLPGSEAVQISLNKDEFQEESDELTFKLESALFSHEVVHLWNAHTVRSNVDQAWLWEGGAEIFAQESIAEHGFVSQENSDAYRRFNYDACLNYLRAVELPSPAIRYQQNEAFDYRCGLVMNYLASAALKKEGGATDIFKIWSAIFKTSLAGNAEISGETYLEAVEGAIANAKVKQALSAWIVADLTPEAASGELLAAALDSIGETWHHD
jgi:hypothetical protein